MFSGVIMSKYIDAIAWVDSVECDYLQQGNHIDMSFYTFEELMKEISA